VAIAGNAVQTEAAVRKVGGRVTTSLAGTVNAVVPKARLKALAATPGVAQVQQPAKAIELVTSQGVSESNADQWQQAVPSRGGAGITIGIVDAGFADLQSEITAGRLPAGRTVLNPVAADSGGCTSPGNAGSDSSRNGDELDGSQHGTAVAEVVHQMAPAATLQLYCIVNSGGFAVAEQAIVDTLTTAHPIKIVTSSLGFLGDGTSATTNFTANSFTSQVVDDANSKGILWVQSAGNNGQDHWTGTFADADGDDLADLNGTGLYTDPTAQAEGYAGISKEIDEFAVYPAASSSSPASATVLLSWDQWPSSSAPITLQATGEQCTAHDPSSGLCIATTPLPTQTVVQQAGDNPLLSLSLSNSDTTYEQYWTITVQDASPFPAVRYDLSYWTDVAASLLSEINPVRAASGSVTEPADAPGALAAGAAYAPAVDQGASAAQALESYSSQGPTSDHRVKPDILGYDCVDSAPTLTEFGGTFCGTSAAAPHVAGAAAQVLGWDPMLTNAQLKTYLEKQTGGTTQSNATGFGLLHLPTPGVGYAKLSAPVRVRDTRPLAQRGSGGASQGAVGKIGAGRAITFSVGSSVPSTATAVAINLTGTNPTQTTFLTALPGAVTGKVTTSTINLSKVDGTGAVFDIVTLPSSHTISIYNLAGTTDAIVDVVGYFSPTATGRYTPINTTRALYTPGWHTANPSVASLGDGRTGVASSKIDLALPSVPAGAVAAIVNVTATNQKRSGFFTLSPTCPSSPAAAGTSTLNYSLGRGNRANMAIVGLGSGNKICLYNSGGPVDGIIDVVGYLTPSSTAAYVPMSTPKRVVDTRKATQVGPRGTPLGPKQSMPVAITGTSVQVGGLASTIPSTAVAAVGGITATAATATSFFEVYPGATVPTGSTVNFIKGQNMPNAAVLNLGAGGTHIYNQAGSAAAVLDISGYFN
jgi:hypothetical protein